MPARPWDDLLRDAARLCGVSTPPDARVPCLLEVLESTLGFERLSTTFARVKRVADDFGLAMTIPEDAGASAAVRAPAAAASATRTADDGGATADGATGRRLGLRARRLLVPACPRRARAGPAGVICFSFARSDLFQLREG